MARRQIKFQDYWLETTLAVMAGGELWRAYTPSQNAGKGRRDLIYVADDVIAWVLARAAD